MTNLVFLLCLASLAMAKMLRDPASFRHQEHVELSNAAMTWKTSWFDVKLDQFTYSDTRTFKMRWLYNMDSYKAGGPVFFYTGNEGDIEGFATATGMMWDLAAQFNAAIIFAEHRFYGQTLPFGNNSYATIANMGYLTSEQALADYAAFITELKNPNNTLPVKIVATAPVIAFGGSYGGMLSAWFRMKYPHIVAGAWASSAPLLYFRGAGVDQGKFDSITTRTFAESGCNNYIIQNAWAAIVRLSTNAAGLQYLNSIYNLDPKTPIRNATDAWNLNYFLREAIEYMAMVDYPYPTNFLTVMPGSPVKVACQRMNAPGKNFTDNQLAFMIGQGAAVYYNSTGKAQPYCIDPSICGDTATAALGSPLGWPWQECSEIIIDMCSRGMPNDFFWNECGTDSLVLLIETCQATFQQFGWSNSVWNINAVPILYGLSMASTSNIILTQGHLDPWSGGGFQFNSSGVDQKRGIYVVEIPGSAHHLDLRTPNKCDPNTISNARYQIVNILSCWVNNCASPPVFNALPQMVATTLNDTQCADVNQGYPWGQASPQPVSNTTKPPPSKSSNQISTVVALLVAAVLRAL